MNNQFQDVCFKSINILEERFNSIRSTSVFVPDKEFSNQSNTSSSNTDVLLMGRYFERIFQLDHWPKNPFNLFCLSPQVRKILIEVFGFHPEIIGHISRYELFPVDLKDITPLAITEQTHFYFAGRLSPQKNIEFIIFTIFYLQYFLSSKINLTLMGNYDNEHHRDLRGCHVGDYATKIKKIVDSLPWPGEKPTFKHNLDEHEWIKHIPTEGVFLSASNLISEDFSVSAAQLQQIGLPQCLPWWGGFKDIKGENIKHFPASYIAHSNESLNKINTKAKIFAADIAKSSALSNHAHMQKAMTTIIPQDKIDLSYLKDRIDYNLKIKGPSLLHLINAEMPRFTLSEEGQQTLSHCRAILAE